MAKDDANNENGKSTKELVATMSANQSKLLALLGNHGPSTSNPSTNMVASNVSDSSVAKFVQSIDLGWTTKLDIPLNHVVPNVTKLRLNESSTGINLTTSTIGLVSKQQACNRRTHATSCRT
ncbi:Uncharacterized protein TCM_024511 [Theobroma cacao]|uniref:Uncharacterized protein n=1 Tax=Theobroma cacao TaxID=3641 RepID=A0A061EXJ8_THECC|nr:Uncharacterized protein TCM_024511 [Theobroma cacao]